MSYSTAFATPKYLQPWRLAATACAALVLLSACNDKDKPAALSAPAATPQASVNDSPPAAVSPVAYTPPSADVLYQMVAPIALYPDKLVAQILAGATYPEQVSAAESWLAQNPGLQKTALNNAVNAQSWDPSIKSLTQFPNVLEQLASNLPWTTALGKAYYNDPADVLNAIQVMRNRAYKAGTLKSSSHLVVSAGSAPSQGDYMPGNAVAAMAQPMIGPPEQYIEIAPTEVSTVYVPQYNPGVVYGEPVPLYGGYRYASAPVAVGVPVAAGLLGFGAGVLLAQASAPHPSWGWHSWDMHWGAPERHDWRPGMPPPPPMARPAVVYNHETYVSQSRTVRNVVQNNQRTENIRVTNIYENAEPHHAMPPAAMAAGVGAAAGAAALAAGHGMGSRPTLVQQAMPAPAQPPGPQLAAPALAMHQQAMAQQSMQAQHAPQQSQQQAQMQQQHAQQAQQQAALRQQQLAQSQQRQAEQQIQMQQQRQQQMQREQLQAQQQAQRDAAQRQQQQQMAQQRAAQQQQRQAEQQAQMQQQRQQQMQQAQQAQHEQQQRMQQAQRQAQHQQQAMAQAQQRAAQMQQRQAVAHAPAGQPHGDRHEHR